METITHEHEQYEAIVSKWEADRQPRRVFFNSIEYSAVKDNADLKFIPVAPIQGFAGGYASNTFSDGAATAPQPLPRKTSSKAKVKSNESEGTVSD